ncbi:MAG: hypothetical protein ACFFAU_15080 [Candidatus Hodarchaeota archaeon]
MSFRMTFPFRRLTKIRSADSAIIYKVVIVFLFTGFTTYILFFETLVIILNLDIYQTSNLMELTGVPEIDILTPLIIISLSPYLYLYTNIFLFGLSLIPWLFAGFVTGIIFGPQHDRLIILSPPFFISAIFMLFFFLLYSISGFGFYIPSIDLLFFVILMALMAISIAMTIFIFCLPMIIPAFIGYSIGRNRAIRPVVPRVFLAQPDRQDPDRSRCQYLTNRNTCSIGGGRGEVILITNLCDNKWNQKTCRFYIKASKTSKERNISLEGDFIDEIQ